jgi:hypothetical protein
VTAGLALLTLLIAPASAGTTQPQATTTQVTPQATTPQVTPEVTTPGATCQTFTRASSAAPQFVRDWLKRSEDQQVRACTVSGDRADPAAPTVQYLGESGVTRRDGVCSYRSHGLVKRGTGAAGRLERYEAGDALQMAPAANACPAPHTGAASGPYVATYDTSATAFVAIMQLWSEVSASTRAFDHACCDYGGTQPRAPPGTPPAAGTAGGAGGVGGTEARARLRAAIEAGQMRAAALARIVRISGSLLHRRYALFVVDPASPAAEPAYYVVYVRKDLRSPYRISGIADTPG